MMLKRTSWPSLHSNYYNLNDKMMSIAGLSGYPAYPKIKDLLPPVKLEYSGNIIAKAFNELGWHWWPSYSGIATKKVGSRMIGSKSSVDITYWPKAIANGVKLKINARVIKITVDKKGKVNGVIYKDKNKDQSLISIFVPVRY